MASGNVNTPPGDVGVPFLGDSSGDETSEASAFGASPPAEERRQEQGVFNGGQMQDKILACADAVRRLQNAGLRVTSESPPRQGNEVLSSAGYPQAPETDAETA